MAKLPARQASIIQSGDSVFVISMTYIFFEKIENSLNEINTKGLQSEIQTVRNDTEPKRLRSAFSGSAAILAQPRDGAALYHHQRCIL